MCKVLILHCQPIRFARFDKEFVNCGLLVLESRPLMLTRRIADSGDENVTLCGQCFVLHGNISKLDFWASLESNYIQSKTLVGFWELRINNILLESVTRQMLCLADLKDDRLLRYSAVFYIFISKLTCNLCKYS